MHEPFPRLDEQPPERPPALWGVREMVLCTIVVLVSLFILFTVIVGPFSAAYGRDAAETLAASSVANVLWNVAMVVAVLWFVRRAGGGLGDLGMATPPGKARPWPGIIAGAVLAFLALQIVVAAYGIIVDTFDLDFLEPDQQVPDAFYDSTVALVILGFAIVVATPFAEEVFFRGFLYGGMRPLIGVTAAALITGFIFALAHYNPGLIIPFTLVGAGFAFAYQRSETLFVPIGAHMLFNLLSFSVLVFVPEARP